MRAAIVAATMLCGLVTGAQAAIIGSTTTLGGFDPYYSQLYQDVPGFNPALGTLNSITVSTRADLSQNVTVWTSDGGPVPAIGLFNTRFEAWIIGTERFANMFTAPSQSVPVSLTPGPIDTGRGTVAARFINSFTVAAADFRLGGVFEPLTILYAIYATPGAGLSFPNDGSSSTRVTGTVDVAYDYTPTAVPEPASLAMLGFGVAALGIARRKSLRS